jgi:hypothetical protein
MSIDEGAPALVADRHEGQQMLGISCHAGQSGRVNVSCDATDEVCGPGE